MTPPDANPDATAGEYGEVEDDGLQEGGRMSFLEHLDEFRRRILYALYAVVASAVVVFAFIGPLFDYMKGYFMANGGELIYTHPTEGFMLQLKIGLLAAVLMASPFVFSQLWMFIAPGLYAKEKRVVVPFVFFSTLLFLGGAAFAHLQAFPIMWQFFASFEDELLSFMPTIREAFSLYTKIILGLGLVFQMPMLIFFLARFGIVTPRFMVRKFKYAVLLMFVVAAIITPTPDIATQLLFVAPMLVLYVISIGVAWVFRKRKTVDDEEAG
jgi:sec-independent protein translocase protein TatC